MSLRRGILPVKFECTTSAVHLSPQDVSNECSPRRVDPRIYRRLCGPAFRVVFVVWTLVEQHEVEGSHEFDGTSPKKRILSAWVDHLYANKIDYAKLKGPELGEKIEFGKEEEHEEEEVPEDEE